MVDLQEVLTTAPALVRICYNLESGEIIVVVDASLLDQGATLGQKDINSKLYISRYKSGLQNKVEATYNTTKREYRGVLKVLKKF